MANTNIIDRILPELLQEKKLTEAREKMLTQAVKQIQKTAEEDRSDEQWFVLGYTAAAVNNNYDALRYFELTIEKNKDFEAAYKQRATVYLKLGENQSALSDLNKAIEIDSDYTLAYIERATVFAEEGEYDKALEDLETASKNDPENPRVLAQHASILEKQGKIKEAVEKYDKAIEQIDDDANLYSQRGVAKLFSNDPEGAEEDFAKAQKLGGANHITAFNLGLALGHQPEKSKQAYQHFTKAFRKKPTLLSEYYDEAHESDISRLDQKLQDILDTLNNVHTSHPGRYYREELIGLLSSKMNDARSKKEN